MGRATVPTLRGCMHALRGSSADAESVQAFGADVDALRLSAEEQRGFREGLRPLRRVDLRIDRIMEADLGPDGAFALGLCVALLGTIGLRIQGESPRRAAPILREAAELIPVTRMALDGGPDDSAAPVIRRLERLRRDIEAAGVDTGTFGRMASITEADVGAAGFPILEQRAINPRRLALYLAGVGVAVAVLGVIVTGRSTPELDLTLHQDLLPVQELTRHSGEVVVRVPFGWGVEEEPEAAAAAVSLWRREVGEMNDAALRLTITTGQGRVTATVERGTLVWGSQ